MRVGQKATVVTTAGLGRPEVLHGRVCHIDKYGRVWVEHPSGVRRCSSLTSEVKDGWV